MPVPDLIHQWRQSLPPHPDEHRTGANWLETDLRDFRALWLPGIAAHAALGPPADSSLAALVREPRLNQGSEGSCVSGSTEGACQMAHSAVDGTWPAYSIHQLYAEAGGLGANGVDVRVVMKICIEKGAPLVAGTRDSLIKSYVFVDAQPGAFRTQVKASLAAGHPVLIASLLPIPFGWNTGMTLSSGYHQYLGIGVMTDAEGKEWVIVLNDWGDGWPGDAPAGTPPGVGRISFDALEQQNMQNGYTYGVIPTMTLVTPPIPTPIPAPHPTPAPIPVPPPPPPASVVVTGKLTGMVVSTVAVGQSLMVQTDMGGGSLLVTQISGQPTPDPQPDPKPDPHPTPAPGGLTVDVSTKRYSSGRAGVWAYIYDPARKPVIANLTGEAGGRIIEPRNGVDHTSWSLVGTQAAVGGTVTVTATAADGRTGSGVATI